MAITYAGFKVIIDARFVSPVNKLKIFIFRACQQDRGQTLEDYITKLQKLAVHSGIPVVLRENDCRCTRGQVGCTCSRMSAGT